MARDFLHATGLSDAGSVRQFNEDRIVVDPDLGILALADGMGGHRAGDVASQLAAETVHGVLRAEMPGLRTANGHAAPAAAVRHSVDEANRAICAAARSHAAHQGMGTTIAVALFHNNCMFAAHVGDSRIYRLRGGRLQLLTRDDSMLHDEVAMGLIAAADAASSRNRNLVTRALGSADKVEPHVQAHDSLPGDVFLLCSDGLNDLVDDDDIALIVDALKANLPLAAHHLVQAAKDNGGYDNVSVILARVHKPYPTRATRGFFGRLFGWLR